MNVEEKIANSIRKRETGVAFINVISFYYFS